MHYVKYQSQVFRNRNFCLFLIHSCTIFHGFPIHYYRYRSRAYKNFIADCPKVNTKGSRCLPLSCGSGELLPLQYHFSTCLGASFLAWMVARCYCNGDCRAVSSLGGASLLGSAELTSHCILIESLPIYTIRGGWTWQYTPVIPELGRWKKEDQEFIRLPIGGKHRSYLQTNKNIGEGK